MTFQPPWERGGAARPSPRSSRALALCSWTAVAVALAVVITLPFIEWGSRRTAETAAHQTAPPTTTGQGSSRDHRGTHPPREIIAAALSQSSSFVRGNRQSFSLLLITRDYTWGAGARVGA